MATIVVLGMHGGGTSLAAGMLYVAGVAMNPNPKGWIPRKRYKTYEDSAFVRLNAAILHAAGGNWKTPPPVENLETMSDWMTVRVAGLIDARDAQHKLWGFKDPRTALTVHLYHPYLCETRYVVVEREPEAVARSLATRTGRSAPSDAWMPLVEVHYERIRRFLERYEPTAQRISYEALIEGDGEVRKLVEFAGVDDVESAVQRALAIVKR
jgi:hypothetical protein